MTLSTHVLDAVTGRPAQGLALTLEQHGEAWAEIGHGRTDADGRCRDLLPGELELATYRITFDTGKWFAAQGVEAFYPKVSVVFRVVETQQHHHVPLLLSPYAYSTYRGS